MESGRITVGKRVGVALVGVSVIVGLCVRLGRGGTVGQGVIVRVGSERVTVGKRVGVGWVGVIVIVDRGVRVTVIVIVGRGVWVGTGVLVGYGVRVMVGSERVTVGKGVAVGWVGVRVIVGRLVRLGAGVTVGQGVLVSVGVPVGQGVRVIFPRVGVVLGVRGLVWIDILVRTAVGGIPSTVKLPLCFHSLSTNICTSYSPGNQAAGSVGFHAA